MRSRLFIKDESNKQTKQKQKQQKILRRETENCFHLTIIMYYTTLKEEKNTKTKQKSIIIIITFDFPFCSIHM